MQSRGLLFAGCCFIVINVAFGSTKRYYREEKISVPLDHFSFSRNDRFQLRYLINDTYWEKGNGPVFFYTGNEGSIELFASHTGFIWDIAKEFSALIIFAEHRYYGDSLPFGNRSFSAPTYTGYLTSSQALADYVDVINHLKSTLNVTSDNRIITFGGSYGGMLAAYFRIKYPHIITGAIAASAPVHQFTGMIPCDASNRIITSSFNDISAACVSNIRKSWTVLSLYLKAALEHRKGSNIDIRRVIYSGTFWKEKIFFILEEWSRRLRKNLTKSDEGKTWVSKEWSLCSPLKNESDSQTLIDYLSDSYFTLAMVNYPYENDFMNTLPPNPVRVFCKFLKNDSLEGKPLLQVLVNRLTVMLGDQKWNDEIHADNPSTRDRFPKSLYKGIDMFSNYTGENKCLDSKGTINNSQLGDDGWDYQACTEMVMPSCANGETDMFEPQQWDENKYGEKCKAKWGVNPMANMAADEYGGNNLEAASNIVFSNGLLDPWAAGGILRDINPTIHVVIIPEGAHHLDLMGTNPSDPNSVTLARKFHKQAIWHWLKKSTVANI